MTMKHPKQSSRHWRVARPMPDMWPAEGRNDEDVDYENNRDRYENDDYDFNDEDVDYEDDYDDE